MSSPRADGQRRSAGTRGAAGEGAEGPGAAWAAADVGAADEAAAALRAGALGTRTGERGASTEPREEEPEASPLEGGRAEKKRTGGSFVVCTPAQAPTRFHKVVARRPLLGEAGAGEGVVGVIRKDCKLKGAPNRRGVRRAGGKAESVVGSMSEQIEAGRHAQE
jgi:hypothetical protein